MDMHLEIFVDSIKCIEYCGLLIEQVYGDIFIKYYSALVWLVFFCDLMQALGREWL